jgi:CheY-like chemotaxis protein
MGRRILVVDDNDDTREALGELVRTWGYEVDVAADGCEAITLCLEHCPDVVLLDIRLPDLDEVARRMRCTPGADARSIIALTGSDDADAEASAFDAYILKPADPDVLRRAVEGASARGDAKARAV